ncbi:MAG: class I SAM-dependent methyltransferase [Candidatus Nitrosotenuis sp.]
MKERGSDKGFSLKLEKEREFFNKFSEDTAIWWGQKTKAGIERNIEKNKRIFKALDTKPGEYILEIGCARGDFCFWYAPLFPDVRFLVTDISDRLIKSNKNDKRFKGFSNITFSVLDAHNTNIDDETFDGIIGRGVLHHLKYDVALREFYRILKPEGRLVFTEPNYNNPYVWLVFTIPFLRRLNGLSDYEMAFTRSYIEMSLNREGFKSVKVIPYDFVFPLLPSFLIKPMRILSNFLETIPFIREFGGSLLIHAKKY